MNRLVITALALISVGTTNAATFAPKKYAAVPSKALDIRGGAGPIAPATAAKVVGGIAGLNGIFGTLAPKPFGAAYECGDLSEVNNKILRRIGVANLTVGLFAYLLLFRNDCDLNMAMGHASLPWVVECIASLLNNDFETVGPSRVVDGCTLAFTGATSFAGITGAGWATNCYKAAATYALFHGIIALFNGEFAAKFWDFPEIDDKTPAISNCIGANLAIMGALYAALAWGIEPVKAFGYTALIAFPISIYNNFFNSNMDCLGINKKALAFFSAMYAVVAASILI